MPGVATAGSRTRFSACHCCFLPINVDAPEEAVDEIAKAQSHFDVATFILDLMGYDVAIQETGPKEIYINGSDLSGARGIYPA